MFKHKRLLLRRTTRRYIKLIKALGQENKTDKMVFFVTGVGRSGSNMLMEIFDRNLNIDVFHETDPRAFSKCRLKSKPVLFNLINRNRLGFIVFKAMSEAMTIEKLLEQYEDSRVFWIYRNYNDQVNSFTKLWPKHGYFVKRLLDSNDRSNWRVHDLSAKTEFMVKQLYEDDLNTYESNAIFWLYRNQSYFDQNLKNSSRIRLVKYEDLVTNPGQVGRKIMSFMGLNYSNKLTTHINSHSVNKNTPAKIRQSIRIECDRMLKLLDDQYDDQYKEQVEV